MARRVALSALLEIMRNPQSKLCPRFWYCIRIEYLVYLSIPESLSVVAGVQTTLPKLGPFAKCVIVLMWKFSWERRNCLLQAVDFCRCEAPGHKLSVFSSFDSCPVTDRSESYDRSEFHSRFGYASWSGYLLIEQNSVVRCLWCSHNLFWAVFNPKSSHWHCWRQFWCSWAARNDLIYRPFRFLLFSQRPILGISTLADCREQQAMVNYPPSPWISLATGLPCAFPWVFWWTGFWKSVHWAVLEDRSMPEKPRKWILESIVSIMPMSRVSDTSQFT